MKTRMIQISFPKINVLAKITDFRSLVKKVAQTPIKAKLATLLPQTLTLVAMRLTLPN